jgi:phosphatidylglycerol:prolipoprotein diacylglycerol transferase
MVGLAVGRIGCFLNGCCWGIECPSPPGIQFPYGSPPYQFHVDRLDVLPPPALIESIDPTSGEILMTPRREAMANPLTRDLVQSERSLPVHPTQLYSFVTALGVAGACLLLMGLTHVPGRAFALMLMLEGAGRFAIEMLRVNQVLFNVGALPFTYSMVVGAGLVVAGILLWFGFGLIRAKSESISQTI